RDQAPGAGGLSLVGGGVRLRGLGAAPARRRAGAVRGAIGAVAPPGVRERLRGGDLTQPGQRGAARGGRVHSGWGGSGGRAQEGGGGGGGRGPRGAGPAEPLDLAAARRLPGWEGALRGERGA